jgi:hypothetical protein
MKEGIVKKYLSRKRLVAACRYCVTHRKQLASAVVFGAGLLESIQKAH